eukprot:PITA_10760
MDQDCCVDLSLSLGIRDATITDEMYVSQRNVIGPPVQLHLFPSAPDSERGTLPWEKTSPSIETIGVGGEGSAGEAKVLIHPVAVSWRSDANKFPASYLYNEDAGAINVSSSNSSTVDSDATNRANGYADIKGKRGYGEELENDQVWPRVLNDVEEEGSSRKKLRFSRDQCAFLEESFKKNRAPESKQKQELALQLNLRPRQVDVWFQNRRARTKLKQIEVDCEVLKRCNEALAEDNRKLHMELEKLKALKMSAPPLRPASTLRMCPSCERVSVINNSNSSDLTLAKSGSIFLGSASRP